MKRRWQPYFELYSTIKIKIAGVDGIKEEFKREIEGYKSPDYADAAWKANPAKNRDKV